MALYNTLKCSYKDCDKPSKKIVKGLCWKHYCASRENRSKEKCNKDNCNRGVYAKGLCRKHYAYIANKYQRKQKKCIAPNCNNLTTMVYCSRHLRRFKVNLSMDLSIDYRSISNAGANSHNWKGGIADYPNHSLLRRVRKEKLKKTPTCEICQTKSAQMTHHKDHTVYNHLISNLQSLCHRCHRGLHPIKTSKFKRLYGMTGREMASKYGCTFGYYSQLHKKGLLKDYLAS